MNLAQRAQAELEVSLDTVGEALIVTVTEFGEPRFTLEATDGKTALDMFYHPFAYYRDAFVHAHDY